jgi:branched-chain amino acid transport system substrate-binding protein
MKKTIMATAAAALLMAGAAQAQDNELRIGFMTTLSGGAAIIGKDMENAFKLGLEHQGWTEDGDSLGGVPTKVLIGDDQRKTDVAVQLANRWVREERVHILGGIIWSNILMSVRNPVVNSRTILMSMNAGAAPMSGRQCSRYFISTSWNNDQPPEASGQLMNDDGIKNVYALAPNYQAGKDMIAGMRRTYKGEVVGQALFPLGNSDFQAEISRVRAAAPEAVFIFAPGGMGINFMKQWAASGAGESIELYTVFVVDYLTIKPIGESAVGTWHTNFWDPNAEIEANQRFIRDYIAKYGRHPSHYGAQSYDAPALIASAVKATGGDLSDPIALMREMRKANFPSIRGEYSYNWNGTPIQNFYKRSVVKDATGNLRIRTDGIVLANHRDAYANRCPRRERLTP